MTIDATGNPIILNAFYGYTQSSNGNTKTVIGKCSKFSSGRITLSHIKESNYMYVGEGQIKPHSINHPERRRNVSSVTCFPVNIETVKTI